MSERKCCRNCKHWHAEVVDWQGRPVEGVQWAECGHHDVQREWDDCCGHHELWQLPIRRDEWEDEDV